MQKSDGMNYAPTAKAEKVVRENEFVFAAACLDHGHIYGQTNGLLDAGGTLKYVYDPDPAKVAAFREKYPQAEPVDSLDRLLEDDSVHLVSAAAIPCDRGPLGLRVMAAGKDYFTDKSPFTTLAQLEDARQAVAATGRKYMVYYSERLHNEVGYHAGELLREGVIGDVIQVIVMAPHRLSKDSRPDWFFDKASYGGILTDIGSHQFEQFLYYTGAKDATVNFARVENFSSPEKPGLEDFGEASLTADTGASCYTRIDWFTPDGSRVWGDGRAFVLGTKGYMELRKYVNVGRPESGPELIIVDNDGEQRLDLDGKVGYPFFGKLILDVLNRTETAMTQEHIFKAAELCLQAQALADRAHG